MDSQGVRQTDKHPPPGSDPYPLNTLDAKISFRAKGSPDLCRIHSSGYPPHPFPFLSAALLLWQAHTQSHIHQGVWWKAGGLIWKWITRGHWTELFHWQMSAKNKIKEETARKTKPFILDGLLHSIQLSIHHNSAIKSWRWLPKPNPMKKDPLKMLIIWAN